MVFTLGGWAHSVNWRPLFHPFNMSTMDVVSEDVDFEDGDWWLSQRFLWFRKTKGAYPYQTLGHVGLLAFTPLISLLVFTIAYLGVEPMGTAVFTPQCCVL